MISNYFKDKTINLSLPSSIREWKNAVRNWKNKARICLFWAGRLLRPMSKIGGLFKKHDKSKKSRPFSFLRFCNENKSYAYIECCYCGGVIDVDCPYFLELFTSNDTATNEYVKTLLERSTKRVSAPCPIDEMAECQCYAAENTENRRSEIETSQRRAKRERFQVIKGAFENGNNFEVHKQ